MIAWELARRFQNEHSGVSFEELLGSYLSCGLVHSTPSVFLLARKVCWDVEKQQMRDQRSGINKLNAWFIQLAAHSQNPSSPKNAIREMMRVADTPLEFVLFHRRGRKRLHSYRWDQLLTKVSH